MKETKRAKILYAIGILAFVIALVSLVTAVLDLWDLYKTTDGNILSGGIDLGAQYNEPTGDISF